MPNSDTPSAQEAKTYSTETDSKARPREGTWEWDLDLWGEGLGGTKIPFLLPEEGVSARAGDRRGGRRNVNGGWRQRLVLDRYLLWLGEREKKEQTVQWHLVRYTEIGGKVYR
jgi:hypothetical protein